MNLLSRSSPASSLCFGLVLTALSLLGPRIRSQDFQGSTQLAPFDEEMFHYSQSKEDTSASRLQKRIDAGELKLASDEHSGYLLAVLDALKIPRSSQTLVFSKTSFQRPHIFPDNPRALYFNDNVYIGWVPGAPLLEISAVDPKLGAVFYTLDQKQVASPKLIRNNECLECHASAKTVGVPGYVVRSFITAENGDVDLFTGAQVNQRTPFTERWGGWYVTGAPVGLTHRGNLAGNTAFELHEKDPTYHASVVELSAFCEAAKYPTPTSDIAALLVLEHQTHLHNLLTRLNYESSLHLVQYGHVRYLKSISEAFLRYLLFIDEAPLTVPVTEKSSFAQQFESQGPRDKQGRSLREFDLQTRTFKYPCSYLIYSEAFDKLPDPMKQHLYHRLYQILSDEDESADYQKIPGATKQAIREILAQTKLDLPVVWRLN